MLSLATKRHEFVLEAVQAARLGNDNLLTIRNCELQWTTDRGKEVEIYLNLASRLKVGGPNQVWIADITYIRLRTEFVYLAVVLDAFSPKVVGWSLDRWNRSNIGC